VILEAEVEWRREEAGGLHQTSLRPGVSQIGARSEMPLSKEPRKNLLKQDETDPLVSA
jgi:hypothetical protein